MLQHNKYMRARRLKGWIIQSWDGNNSDEIKLIKLDNVERILLHE